MNLIKHAARETINSKVETHNKVPVYVALTSNPPITPNTLIKLENIAILAPMGSEHASIAIRCEGLNDKLDPNVNIIRDKTKPNKK